MKTNLNITTILLLITIILSTSSYSNNTGVLSPKETEETTATPPNTKTNTKTDTNTDTESDYKPNTNTDTITLPKGTYYIGDLCYVFSKPWSKIVEAYFEGLEKNGYKQINEVYIEDSTSPIYLVIFYTGDDGIYRIKDTNEDFCVDSGSIGLVNIKYLNPTTLKENGYLGQIKEFQEDFQLQVSPKEIKIGDMIIIQTDD
jgi:hypothetical protein